MPAGHVRWRSTHIRALDSYQKATGVERKSANSMEMESVNPVRLVNENNNEGRRLADDRQTTVRSAIRKLFDYGWS